MMKLRYCSPVLTILLAALLLIPARAQDVGNGRGVVRIAGGNTSSEAWLSLVLPRLFDIDPTSGALLDAHTSDRALVRVIPPNLPSDEVTLALDENWVWSDGEPVTSYDVLFSLLMFSEVPQNAYFDGLQELAGARIVDDHTIGLRFAASDAEIADLPADIQPLTATCDDLPRSNIYIVHSKTLVSEFREFVDHDAPEDDSPSLAAWHKAYRDANLPSLLSAISSETSGAYALPDFAGERNDHLVPVDGTGAALVGTFGDTGVDGFIAGETDAVLDVPISERAHLRTLAHPNARNFQIAEVPGRVSYIVVLNLANQRRPLPGFHPETGELVEQGAHPVYSDINVRQALQLAIDQNTIIDGVMQRSASPLAGLFAPGSWAYDAAFSPTETNPEAAKRLLDEAGWLDNGSGRRCVGCQTAPEGTELQVSLGASDSDYEIADQLTQQWRSIGVAAYPAGEDLSRLTGQTFDAYLVAVGGSIYEDADPDRTLMLTPAGDILNPNMPSGVIMNYGSYNNPEVTHLLEQARMLPGCDPSTRAEIYHQLERLLRQDLPFLSVAAPDEFYAAAPNVLGFAPRTGDPLWNVESWVMSP